MKTFQLHQSLSNFSPIFPTSSFSIKHSKLEFPTKNFPISHFFQLVFPTTRIIFWSTQFSDFFFENFFHTFLGIKFRASPSLPIVLFKIQNSIFYCNNYLTIWLFWTTAGKLNQTLIRHFNSDKPVLTECYKYQPRYFIDNFNRKWTEWLQIQGQFQDQGQ